MTKKIILVMLLVPQLVFAVNNIERTNRLANDIASNVQSLTSEQLDSISLSAATYFSALQTANVQYPTDVKTRISVKAEADSIFNQSLQRIMTSPQWQQWNNVKETRQQQLAEQHKN